MSTGCRAGFGAINRRQAPPLPVEQDVVMQRERVEPRATEALPSARTSIAHFRPDIQGLRAVAVIAVVAHHLIGWPVGGFVGVDVFFVISGFLITDLLLREHQLHGRISLIGFYRRRARRILPAAIVCLVAVTVAAFLVYRSARFDAVVVDALTSLLFVANWRFAQVGTEYLASAGPVSPLQHFWSLGVEEQFYLLWPVLLVVLLGAIGRNSRGRSATAPLAVLLAAGAVGSFAWAVVQTASSPSWAYFSTLSRVWELAAGALLAVLANRLAAVPPVHRSWLLLGGMGLIAAGMFLITPAMAVPGPWSAVPVAGALGVLAAGIGGQPRHSGVLTNPAAMYVGQISYSLYLWHFPVIVLLAALLPAGPMSLLATAVVMIAVSVGSFHLVEERFRDVSRTRPVQRHPRRVVTGRAVALVIAVVATVVLAGNTVTADSTSGGRPLAEVADGDPAAQLSAELDAALQSRVWPELTPAIDGIAETGRPPRDKECAVGLADPNTPADHLACVFGNPTAPRLAIVAGDSIGITWIPMVRKVLEPRGYRVQGLTMSGCPFVETETINPAANISAFCPGHKAAVLAAIQRLKPDIVVVSNTYRPFLKDLPDVDIGASRYADGERSMVDRITASTGAVYVLAPPPPGRAPEECATNLSAPANCVSGIPDYWQRFNDEMAVGLSGAPRTTYVDTSSWFCAAAGQCPSFVGHTLTRRDAAGHIVPAYAQRLAPLFERMLDIQGR